MTSSFIHTSHGKKMMFTNYFLSVMKADDLVNRRFYVHCFKLCPPELHVLHCCGHLIKRQAYRNIRIKIRKKFVLNMRQIEIILKFTSLMTRFLQDFSSLGDSIFNDFSQRANCFAQVHQMFWNELLYFKNISRDSQIRKAKSSARPVNFLGSWPLWNPRGSTK